MFDTIQISENQLPLATIQGIEIDGFQVVSANHMDCVQGAIAIARATGSRGASEFWRSAHNGLINRFAFVKRIKS